MTSFRLTFLLVLLWSCMTAQYPLTVSAFDFTATPVRQIAIGDADDNGLVDIYLIAEGLSQITRLTNQGNGIDFTADLYHALSSEPVSLGVLSLNGGDDLYYTLEGEPGMFTLLGKDTWNNEKDAGPVLFDQVLGLSQAHLNQFNFSNLVVASDQDHHLHFVQIVAGSFNIIQILSGYTFDPNTVTGLISTFSSGDRIDYILPDVAAGQLLMGSTQLGFPLAEYNDQLELIDADLQHPVASLSYTDPGGTQMMFVLDTGTQQIYKYVRQGGSFLRTTIDTDFSDPVTMAMGFIDQDAFPDLVVADGKNLWLLSNAPSRSGSLQPELMMTYDEVIDVLIVADVNGDGLGDIITVPVTRDKILVSRNDLLLNAREVTALSLGYWPNPTGDQLYFPAGIQPDEVEFIALDGQVFLPVIQNGTIDLRYMPSGAYMVRTKMNQQVYLDKIIIQSAHK